MSLKNLEQIPEDYRPHIQNYLSVVLIPMGIEKIHALILYGPIVRGEVAPHDAYKDPVNLVVVSEGISENISERIKRIIAEEADSPLEAFCVQSVWITPDELIEGIDRKSGFILEILLDGIIIFEKNNYLTEKIEELKKQLKEKGVERTKDVWKWPPHPLGESFKY